MTNLRLMMPLLDRRFVRFLVIGCSNFLIGLVLFQTAYSAGASFGALRTPLAQVIAYGLGMIWSFVWNRLWAFGGERDRLAPVAAEASRFFATQLGALLISAILVSVAIDGLGLSPIVGWLVTMVPLTVLNFYVTSEWVFPASRATGGGEKETPR